MTEGRSLSWMSGLLRHIKMRLSRTDLGVKLKPKIVQAGNRQLKMLRLFGVDVDGAVPYETARDLIGDLLSVRANRSLWERYVYLTDDLDAASPRLRDFDPNELHSVKVPRGWCAEAAERAYRKKRAADILVERGLFDSPEPEILLQNRVFMFSGQFSPGVRELSEAAILQRGGLISRSAYISYGVDYFVLGAVGNSSDRWDAYFEIEAVVVDRETYGKPAIITHTHLLAHL